jgi:hypothetical protein
MVISGKEAVWFEDSELHGHVANPDNIFEEASAFSPFEKAQLIDKLISSLDKPDKEIDKLWAKEAEDRIDARDDGSSA